MDDVSSAASSIWLAMAGKPPKGAEKVFPPWASEFLDKGIPSTLLPYPPCAGDENLVGSKGCSLLPCWDTVCDEELF